jgi:hypothetical protein
MTEAEDLVRKIELLLAGKPRLLQSTILADLLATWLAGHFDLSGNRKKTEAMRKQVLEHHLGLVRDLLPFNERELEAKIKAGVVGIDDLIVGFGIDESKK